MPFPFTFSFTVPGLSNPFSKPTSQNPVMSAGKHKITRPRPSPSPIPLGPLSAAAPTSRKRGWEPAFVEPSLSMTTLASSSGYLDTPAKYREMALASGGASHVDELHEAHIIASDIDMPPPAKRRRGLAGSIVSTALSAALIGTAVGLTVYRLWRDRGKEPERLPPPPPYDQGEWTPEAQTPPLQITAAPAPAPASASAPTISSPNRNRKPRHAVGSMSKRAPIPAHRRSRPRGHLSLPHAHAHAHAPSTALFPPPQPEFNFARQDKDESGADGVESQMDWIGDKLSMLIEEGKKALNREIVVMSDAKEDEVDDGSGAWEEDAQAQAFSTVPGIPSSSSSLSISRSNSAKRSRRPVLSPNTFESASSSASPSLPSFLSSSSSPPPSSFPNTYKATPSIPITTPRPSRSRSRPRGLPSASTFQQGHSESTSFREDEHSWASPELKESMEKARARAMMNVNSGFLRRGV